jgi:hypothetical protein
LNSSASDCSDQSGWVSSTMSSRQNSPPPARHRCRDEPIYPELDPAPLAPPVHGLTTIFICFFVSLSGPGSSPVEKLCCQAVQPELDAHLAQAGRSA